MSMGTVITNPLPTLLALLLAQDSLTDLVTGGDVASGYATSPRIYIGGLPAPLITNTAFADVLPPTVVLKNARMGGDPNLGIIQRGTVELRCYDIDEAAARELWYFTLNLLRAMTPYRSGGVTVEVGLGHSGPFDGVEPGGGFVMASGTLPLQAIG